MSNMENKNNNLIWLFINKYAPELKTNNIKETLLKSGVTFFNLHHMEKGYFPTSLIKFQVENKTDISYLTNKNIRIGDREYALRRFIEKPRQNNRYRYTNFTEKPRRYVKPHPSTRFRKENITSEKTVIEPKKTNIEPITNNQKHASREPCRHYAPPRYNSKNTPRTQKHHTRTSERKKTITRTGKKRNNKRHNYNN